MHGTRPASETSSSALADLTYATDLEGGITREAAGDGFVYRNASGKRIKNARELERIASLAIPPAYTDVLISADPNTHLQATGRDARGRKQYRYHPDWLEERGREKFSLLPLFATRLPAIRKRVDADLRRRKPDMRKALATVVWLLDRLMIRIGNQSYAEENGSYGLTTLKNRHVRLEGATASFRFKGKSGKEWNLKHSDRRITRAIRTLQELPGQQLFQYIDEDGKCHPIRSQDVNGYIREAASGDFSSRQFRTWGATAMAATALSRLEAGQSKAETKRLVNGVIDEVAARLVNTRAVCRSSYIHPLVFEHFETGELAALGSGRRSGGGWMSDDERRVLTWLKRHSGGDGGRLVQGNEGRADVIGNGKHRR